MSLARSQMHCLENDAPMQIPRFDHAPNAGSGACTPVARLERQYRSDLEANGGLVWSERDVDTLQIAGLRAPINTIPNMPPGYLSPTFPRDLDIDLAPPRMLDLIEHNVQRRYRYAIEGGLAELALRCCIVEGLMLRDRLIDGARTGGALLHGRDAFAPLPVEMRPVLNGMAYGSTPLELALMGAIGMAPTPGSLAGVDALMPIYTVACIRTTSPRTRRTASADIPSLLAKVTVAPEDADAEPLAFARACARAFDATLTLEERMAPLRGLEFRLLTCIPASEILLPASGDGRAVVRTNFGVRHDTRHLWLLGRDTCPRQIRASVLFRATADGGALLGDTPGDIGWPRHALPAALTAIEPTRRRAMACLRNWHDREERAMCKAIFGFVGFDRMTLGRALRPAADGDGGWELDDASAVGPAREGYWSPTPTAGDYWAPPTVAGGAWAYSPSASPPTAAPSEWEGPSLQEAADAVEQTEWAWEEGGLLPAPGSPPAVIDDDLPPFADADGDWNLGLLAMSAAPPPPPPPPPYSFAPCALDVESWDALFDAQDAEAALESAPASGGSRKRKRRAPPGTGRFIINADDILEWATSSLTRGAMQGGSCSSVCVNDTSHESKHRHVVAPGIVIHIVDGVIRQALAAMRA